MVRPGRRRAPGRAAAGARLSGGVAAGRRISTETGTDLRPTTGLVRKACFDILGQAVLEVRAVDLFAGSGSLGLEALSRGASQVTFVEVRRNRAARIAANLAQLGWEDRGRVVPGDALSWLRQRREDLLLATLVLLDPPYLAPGPELGLAALRLLGEASQVAAEWQPTVVAEHHRSLLVPSQAGALNCVRSSRYGSTVLSFYRRSR
ncbi:MAG: RsmD family RNA methyltransferase [Candidatus Dormibacteria bacterium]